MMRGLIMDFRNDPKAWNIPDQFMFGPAIMVNPVTKAGAATRPVYLPAAEFGSISGPESRYRAVKRSPHPHPSKRFRFLFVPALSSPSVR